MDTKDLEQRFEPVFVNLKVKFPIDLKLKIVTYWNGCISMIRQINATQLLPFVQYIQYENRRVHLCQRPHGFPVSSVRSLGTLSAKACW